MCHHKVQFNPSGLQYTRYYMISNPDLDSNILVEVCCLIFKNDSVFTKNTSDYLVHKNGKSIWDDKGGFFFSEGNYRISENILILNYLKTSIYHADLIDTMLSETLVVKKDTLFVVGENSSSSSQEAKGRNKYTSLDSLIDKLSTPGGELEKGYYWLNKNERCMEPPIDHPEIYENVINHRRNKLPHLEGP